MVDRILNIAHRGASSLAPENTLSAARKGLEAGADMWELDVQLTADGELIVIHDSTLKRTSNVEDVFPHRRPWQVHEFTLDEIRKHSHVLTPGPYVGAEAQEDDGEPLEEKMNRLTATLRQQQAEAAKLDAAIAANLKEMGYGG